MANAPPTLAAPPKGDRSSTTAPEAGLKLPRTLQKSKPSFEPTMVKERTLGLPVRPVPACGSSKETRLVPAKEPAW